MIIISQPQLKERGLPHTLPLSLSRKTIRTTSVVGNGRAQLGGSFIAAGLPCLPPSLGEQVEGFVCAYAYLRT